jgi:hypothetical protein
MKVGKDAVVMGNVPGHAQIGDGSVVVGATDSNGNTILNQPMAVGRGAYAGPGGIAIGAFAGAAGGLAVDVEHLAKLIGQQSSQAVIDAFERFNVELSRTTPEKSKVLGSWEALKAAGAVSGAHDLMVKISASLYRLFGT